MNPIIRVLMCEIVGKAVLFGYRSDGQLLLLWGAKKWQDVSLSDNSHNNLLRSLLHLASMLRKRCI